MNKIEQVKKKISILNINEKVYKDNNLTTNQQFYERGKPKKYLEAVLELFAAIGGKRIVEIGAMRTRITHPLSEFYPLCCNDGHSTFFWACSGAEVFSVDKNRKSVSAAKKSCKKFKNVKVFRSDGIKFLEKFKKTIDLLFLDAWEVDNRIDYAENHLIAYLKAKPNLNKTNIVVIDDTDIAVGGKGRLLIPVLQADKYEILVKGRQTIAFAEYRA